MVDITGFASKAFGHLIGNLSELPAAEAIIFDIAIILIISAILAFIAKVLKQPLIPATTAHLPVVNRLFYSWDNYYEP